MEHIFYLANVFDALSTLFKVFMVLSTIATLVLTIGFAVESCVCSECEKELILIKKWAIRSGVILLISVVGYLFTPSKSTYLLMKGGKIVEEAYKNSSDLQELPKNTAEFLNEYVKTLTKELKDANTE